MPIPNRTSPARFAASAFAVAAFAALWSAGADAATRVYEDASDGSAARWSVYDADPPGAAVSVADDPDAGGRVIVLDGAGRANGYRLGGTAASNGGWNDSAGTALSWRARAGEPFTVYVAASTARGFRYLFYDATGADRGLISGRYIHYGIGADASDGRWRAFARDLAQDLAGAEPGNTLVAVHGFLVRGDVRLDDIAVHDSVNEAPSSGPVGAAASAVYEDAEDGSPARWSIYDASPAGASVSVVVDPETGGRVIALDGAGRSNGYRLGGTAASNGGWNDTSRFVLSWRMRTRESFSIYVAAATERGFRYLLYDPADTDRGLLGGRYVHHGLGGGVADGSWHTLTRDLGADLAAVEPGNTLLAVHGFLVRGNLHVDDVGLHVSIDAAPDPSGPVGPANLAPVADAGPDLAVELGGVVTLDGSGSSDADGAIVAWRWTLADGTPLGTGSALAWTPASAGPHPVTLTVTDDDGASAADSLDVSVSEPAVAGPPPGFRLFNAMLYAGMPDIGTRLPVAYQQLLFDPGVRADDTPTDAGIAAAVADVRYQHGPPWNASTELAILDIERWHVWPFADDAEHEASLTRYGGTMQRFRAELGLPTCQYSVVPQAGINNVFLSITRPDIRAAWDRASEVGQRLVVPHVDAMCPAAYTYYDRPSQHAYWMNHWQVYARETIREARRIAPGKPVYVFLWPQFHPGGLFKDFRYIPEDYWRLEIETALDHADGIVLWGGWDHVRGSQLPWNPNAAWYRVVREYFPDL